MRNPLPTSGHVLPCAVPNFTAIPVVIAQPAYAVYDRWAMNVQQILKFLKPISNFLKSYIRYSYTIARMDVIHIKFRILFLQGLNVLYLGQ